MAPKIQEAFPKVSSSFKKSHSRSMKSGNRRKPNVRYVSPYFESNFEKKDGETIVVVSSKKRNFIEQEQETTKRESNSDLHSVKSKNVRYVSPYFESNFEKKDGETIVVVSSKKRKVIEQEQETTKRELNSDLDSVKSKSVRYVSPYFESNFDKADGETIVVVSSKKRKVIDQGQETRKTESFSDSIKSENDRFVSPYFESNFVKADGESETTVVLSSKKSKTIEEEPKKRKRNYGSNSIESENVQYVSPYFKSNFEKADGKSIIVVSSKKRKTAEEGPERKQIRKSVTLSAAEKRDEAYRRKCSRNTWVPPRSDIGLLQEDHVHDPWRVLAICILLNRTTGTQVRNVLDNFFNLCPNAKVCTEVAEEEIRQVIRSLGLHERAGVLQRMSREYLSNDWTHVTQLPGIGKYAGDAYAIFCTGKWDQVKPEDHKLVPYWEFLHSIKHKL